MQLALTNRHFHTDMEIMSLCTNVFSLAVHGDVRDVTERRFIWQLKNHILIVVGRQRLSKGLTKLNIEQCWMTRGTQRSCFDHKALIHTVCVTVHPEKCMSHYKLTGSSGSIISSCMRSVYQSI